MISQYDAKNAFNKLVQKTVQKDYSIYVKIQEEDSNISSSTRYGTKNRMKKDKEVRDKLRNKTKPLKDTYSPEDWVNIEYAPYHLLHPPASFSPTQPQIGVDEAGRGPMIGRVYSAAVILPSSDYEHIEYKPSLIKDSKRFSSKKKIREVYDMIKTHAVAYGVGYREASDIDKTNIRLSTHQAMHEAIHKCIEMYNHNLKSRCGQDKPFLVIDGNDFTPYEDHSHICVEGGDNWYRSIAAASILAKVERDDWIDTLCEQNPELNERYDLLKNKGYGTKKHIDGIKTYGISEFHRKTFGICRNYASL